MTVKKHSVKQAIRDELDVLAQKREALEGRVADVEQKEAGLREALAAIDRARTNGGKPKHKRRRRSGTIMTTADRVEQVRGIMRRDVPDMEVDPAYFQRVHGIPNSSALTALEALHKEGAVVIVKPRRKSAGGQRSHAPSFRYIGTKVRPGEGVGS